MKKCVEDAKIWTLRADWHGRWVSLSVDLLNIKSGGRGGGFLTVLKIAENFKDWASIGPFFGNGK